MTDESGLGRAIHDTFASRTALMFLFLSTKNTCIAIAVAFGVGIPLDALFAFEATCFLGLVGRNGVDAVVNYKKETTQYSSQPMQSSQAANIQRRS